MFSWPGNHLLAKFTTQSSCSRPESGLSGYNTRAEILHKRPALPKMHVPLCQILNLNSSLLTISDWEIQPGECWAILGRNGAGKRHLANLLTGSSEAGLDCLTHRFRSIALLSFEAQQALYEEELKKDDTDFLDHPDQGTTVRELLGVADHLPQELGFLGLDKLLDRGYRLLSSGEARKTLLAQAILQKPDLLILDEPFDSLDAGSKQQLQDFFQHLLSEGTTVLLFLLTTTEEIFPWHTHVAVMEKGKMLAKGARSEILADADVAALLAFDPQLLPPWPAPLLQTPPSEPLVVLHKGRVSYGETLIFENIELTINKGSHTLVTGPNGSGKSTLLNLLTGDHPQCYGNDLAIFGHKRGSGETIWELKRRIGIVSPGLHRDHRVSGSALHIVLGGFFDSIGLYDDVSASQIEHAKNWLALVSLSHHSNTSFKQLSYGEQRLVLIARALVKQPLLLVLDEPTQGLDEVNRHRVMYFLEHLSSQTQTTIIMASHRFDEHLPLFVNYVAL
jgi:molybdate transport system ATP-binding protein